jgi:predicted RNase H-like nuclease
MSALLRPSSRSNGKYPVTRTASILIFYLSSMENRILVALDQPTVVPNLTSNRPEERLVGSLVGWNGGGTQSSNRGKVGMFCDASDCVAWIALSAGADSKRFQ